MKVTVFGKTGQLARSLRDCENLDIKCTFLSRDDCDLCDPAMIRSALSHEQPDIIINAAAYTDVDRAEREPTIATKVNSTAPKIMAKWAATHSTKFIHISTDFVFNGMKQSPYTPDDEATPICCYGKSKRKGEMEAIDVAPMTTMIIRTAWLYSEYGNNFVKTMLKLMQERDKLSIVNDQRGSPTYAATLARIIMQIIKKDKFKPGIYHWTDRANVSWYEFARKIQHEALAIGLLERGIPIAKISSEQYPALARRPAYSVLETTKMRELLSTENDDWQVNLRLALTRIARHI